MPSLTALALSLILCAPSTVPASSPAELALAEGQRLAEAGALDAAVDRFYRAVSLEPSAEGYLALGRTHRTLEHRDLAYFAYRHALDLAPEDGEALGSVVDLAQDLGRLDEAEAVLPRLEAADADAGRRSRVRLLCARGERALAGRKLGEAARRFRDARALGGDEPRSLAGLRRALFATAAELERRRRPAPLLASLLELYPLEPSPDLARRLRAAFLQAGSPASRAAEVRAIEEHAAGLAR